MTRFRDILLVILLTHTAACTDTLHVVAYKGQADVVTVLLERGANAEARTTDRRRCIMRSCHTWANRPW